MIFYALMDLSHWWPITLSTTGTVAFLIAKVTYSVIPNFFLFMSALKSCFPLMQTRNIFPFQEQSSIGVLINLGLPNPGVRISLA
jgi:hypothetical protein